LPGSASSSLDLSVAGVTMVRLVDAPQRVNEVAHLIQAGRDAGDGDPAPVEVRWRAPQVVGEPRSASDGVHRVVLDERGRCFLSDRDGRLAELPSTDGVTSLVADPALDSAVIPTYLYELVRWRAGLRGVVMLHASAVALPEGGVVLLGGEGAGKTSALLALLPEARAVLADDRVLVGHDRMIEVLGADVQLALGRPYSLPGAVKHGLGARQRTLLRILGRPGISVPTRYRDQFVRYAPDRAFPGLERPSRTPARFLVQLQRAAVGDTRAAPMTATETATAAREAAVYWHDYLAGPCEALRAQLEPAGAPLADAELGDLVERTRTCVDGLVGVRLFVAPRARPGDLRSALRSVTAATPSA
jgi:hypothetical protein